MVFNTAILTAFFSESFDFVRVFIGLRRLGFSGHRLTRVRLRVSLCGLMLHANVGFHSSLLVWVSNSVSSSAAVLSLKRHVSRLILNTTGMAKSSGCIFHYLNVRFLTTLWRLFHLRKKKKGHRRTICWREKITVFWSSWKPDSCMRTRVGGFLTAGIRG